MPRRARASGTTRQIEASAGLALRVGLEEIEDLRRHARDLDARDQKRPRALRPRRSGQLRRRWERAARGGRDGGDKLAGKEATVTVCCRQWAIHERRSWRPATSFHHMAASAPIPGRRYATDREHSPRPWPQK